MVDRRIINISGGTAGVSILNQQPTGQVAGGTISPARMVGTSLASIGTARLAQAGLLKTGMGVMGTIGGAGAFEPPSR